jgi:23S rRNA (pseudouridine1915-N3)-methyltransferase
VKLTLLCVGKAGGTLGAAIQDYEKRLSRYWKFEVVEVEAGVGKGRKSDAEGVLRTEEERLLKRLSEGWEVVALTRDGRAMTSPELARFLEERALASTKNVGFVIGGAYGLGPAILGRAGLKLCLSDMTLPHEMARLVLAEQLYRAGTILRNEPYHKGTER